jgi:hypothetical protein
MMKKSRLKILLDWLHDYCVDILMIVAPFIFGLGQFIITDEVLKLLSGESEIATGNVYQSIFRKIGISAMVISFIVFIVVVFFHIKRQKRMIELELSNSQLTSDLDSLMQNIDAMVKGYIVNIAKDLDFGGRSENSERITLYYHDSDGHFIPFGRYSSNPVFEPNGRKKHRDNQGIIAKAWENGKCFDLFPDPTTEKKEYLNIRVIGLSQMR